MPRTVRDVPVPDVRALLEKYETLARWRRARDAAGALPVRTEFVALAARFPGALRELDTLPLDEIDRRVVLLATAACDPSRVAPWMHWQHDFHAFLRVARWLRTHAGSGAAEASAHAGFAVPESFVASVRTLADTRGRVRDTVIEHLASVHGVTVDVLRASLLAPLSQ